jgi:hypothetical protein
MGTITKGATTMTRHRLRAMAAGPVLEEGEAFWFGGVWTADGALVIGSDPETFDTELEAIEWAREQLEWARAQA